MQGLCPTHCKGDLTYELLDAKYLSLMLDCSTDKGGVAELILYVRYTKNNGVRKVFL
jgi:hypothetical protein